MLTQSFVSRLLNFRKSSRAALTISLFMLLGSFELVAGNVINQLPQNRRIVSVVILHESLLRNDLVDCPEIIQSPGVGPCGYGFPYSKPYSPRSYGPPFPKPVFDSVFEYFNNSPVRVR